MNDFEGTAGLRIILVAVVLQWTSVIAVDAQRVPVTPILSPADLDTAIDELPAVGDEGVYSRLSGTGSGSHLSSACGRTSPRAARSRSSSGSAP